MITKLTLALLNNRDLSAHAIYTYDGDVFCLKDGRDFYYDYLSQNEKYEIANEILEGNYRIDPTFQG